MDSVKLLCALQIIFLCYRTEPAHAQDASIDNIQVTAVESNVSTRPGRNVRLRCAFSPSYPEGAQVYWRRQSDDGSRLVEGRTSRRDRRRFRARPSRSRDFYDLLMREVWPSQTDTYFCGVELNGVVKEARISLTVVVLENERGTLSISTRREQVQGRLGGMGALSCNYQPRFPQHTQFYWRKEDGTRVATGASVVYESDRISARIRGMSANYGLIIRNLEPSDRGVYFCGFEQNGAVGEARVNLTVLVPPEILQDESSPFSLTARAGSDLDIQCIATGTPQPNIIWTAVSHLVTSDSGAPTTTVIGHGSTLTLHDVRRSNISYYRCIADNGIRPTTAKIFFVEVTDSPVIRIPNPTIGGVSGGVASLSCDVIANPMGQSYWIFEGRTVTNSSTHTVLESYRRGDELTLSLTIRPLSNRNFGQYTCQATNPLGTASGTLDLVRRSGP